MTRTALAAAAAVLPLAALSAAPVPKPQPAPALYYPVTAGATWVYACGDEQSTHVVRTVVRLAGGKHVVTTAELDRDGKESARGIREVSADGIHVVEVAGVKPQEPLWEFRAGLKAGQSWECVMGTSTVRGEEEVTVPASTFTALRVEFVPLGVPAAITRWHAKGVGEVKITSAGRDHVLKSFTPGKP